MTGTCTWPLALPVYDIPQEQLADWDAFDDRVSCGDCARGSSDGVLCPAHGPHALQVPHDLKHHCADFRPIVRRFRR